MRVATFWTQRGEAGVRDDATRHEEAMNKWLEVNTGARVVTSTTVQTGEQYHTGLLTTIFYEKK